MRPILPELRTVQWIRVILRDYTIRYYGTHLELLIIRVSR